MKRLFSFFIAVALVYVVAEAAMAESSYILLSRYYAMPEESITVVGSGFMPREAVMVSMAGVTARVIVDDGGGFTSPRMKVSYGLIDSRIPVMARGLTSGIFASSNLVVGTYYPVVAPSTYYVTGNSISFLGRNFAPGEPVAIRNGATYVGRAIADAAGSFATVSYPVSHTTTRKIYTLIGERSGVSTNVRVWISPYAY